MKIKAFKKAKRQKWPFKPNQIIIKDEKKEES